MIRLATVTEMQAIEASADANGVSYAQMMETAGFAVAERAKTHLVGRASQRALVLVGTGNNGGDGLVAARHLAAAGVNVAAYLVRPREDDVTRKAREAGVTILDKEDFDALRNLAAGADVIIDALLGTGAKPPLHGTAKAILQHVAVSLEGKQAEMQSPTFISIIAPVSKDSKLTDRPAVIAVDLPSGVDADSGEADPAVLSADETVTFETMKLCHITPPAAFLCGTVYVAPLHLPQHLPELTAIKRSVVDAASVGALLPKRPRDANKGTFGKVLIVGGSERYIGAPALAALAAYRVGAGLVTVASPQDVINALAGQLLEVTWLPLPDGSDKDEKITDAAASLGISEAPDYEALAIGMGLGRTLNAITFVENILSHGEGQLPRMVLDADALNMLATMDHWWAKIPARTVLTPHPGEMARLAKLKSENGVSAAQLVQRDRLKIASEKAKAWNCVVTLKGAYTVIADPDERVAVLPIAESALAKAGTGDVLAGMIAGFLAQGLDPFDAACVAGYLHAVAGMAAAQHNPRGLLASEVIQFLPTLLNQLESERSVTS